MTSTVFPYTADWTRPPVISFSVPSTVIGSKLVKEQRSTTFDERDVFRRYENTYIGYDLVQSSSIRNKIIQGKAGTFFIPVDCEPVYTIRDFSQGALYMNRWSGSDHIQIGGPSWWQNHRLVRPEEELAGPSTGTFVQDERVIRINRFDYTDFQTKTLVSWDFNTLGLGFLSYDIDSAWTGTSQFGTLSPTSSHNYYHMDEVMLVSFQERPITDTISGFEIVWESIR